MSAVADTLPRYRRMKPADVNAVVAIENAIYPHPWTRGNFVDSLNAGYDCWIMECAKEMSGYIVLMLAIDEAHLLNLSVAALWQRRGLGRELVSFAVQRAREFEANKIFLEVRPSNMAGRKLYASTGFNEIALRRGYYPAHRGREDAIIMELELK